MNILLCDGHGLAMLAAARNGAPNTMLEAAHVSALAAAHASAG